MVRSGTCHVATLMGVTTTKLQEYNLRLWAVKGDFTPIDKRELLILDNPQYTERIANLSHLIGVELEDQSSDRRLPIQIILGANKYALMALGIGADVSAGFLAVDAVSDYEKLCTLDVLGLADSLAGDQLEVYKEFREQVTPNPEKGWYKMGLPWKGGHPPLPTNKEGSLRRLFCYKRLIFRISSAPEPYQHIIQQVLQGCKGAHNIEDDIVVHGRGVEEHDKRLDGVFQRLKERGLTVKPDKCEFRIPRITFMGHVLSEKGIGRKEEKVKAVSDARGCVMIMPMLDFDLHWKAFYQ